MLVLTTDFHGTSRNSVQIKATLEKIAGAGFTHVHWGHEGGGSYLYSQHEMLQIREWCGGFGLKVKGVHTPSGERNSDLKDYASTNEYNRLAGVELIKNRVDLAYILEAQGIIVHLKLPWQLMEKEGFSEDYLKITYKTFDELEPYCKTRHIRLCVENVYTLPSLGCQIFDALCRRYDSDFMGFCFDTGHACVHCKENQLVYAERYNDRMFMIHIHDNHGVTDEHLIPFEGVFDWEGFAKVLARSPYSLPILVESMNEAGEEDVTWLKRAFEAGNRFTAKVENLRA